MMRVRLDLDDRTYDALMLSAVIAMRPVAWHAVYLLRTALGTLPQHMSDPEEHPSAVISPEAQEDEADD